MIDVVSVTQRFGSVLALDDVSLHVAPGEVLCLLGSNGAGKTTLLNVLLGFVTPTSGAARIDGLDVAAHPLETKRRLGYVPEQAMLYGALTGLENLRFFSELSGARRSDAELVGALADTGLPADDAARPVATYSKGMRQKVALAIALARDARVLLLDEPLSGLDPKAANELSRRLRDLGGEGRAIVVTTHDLFRARETGSRIGIMRAGRLLQTVEADALDATALERLYLQANAGET